MPLVEYSQTRPCNIKELVPTGVHELQDYFTVNEVNLKIRKHSKIGYPIDKIVNSVYRHEEKSWLGLKLFNDYQFNPEKAGPNWRYYVCKFPTVVEQTELTKTNNITVVLNFLRTVVPLMLRSMSIHIDDHNSQLLVRSLIHVELTGSQLRECANTQRLPEGFSKIIHFKITQSPSQLTVMAGYTQSHLQIIYLLLTFRHLNCKRLKLSDQISLGSLDVTVQHLIQVLRRMAKANDYNLYGKGIKAVFQTYLMGQKLNNVQKIKERLQEHRRLLLLYECQYARISVFNATLMGKLDDLVQCQDLLYDYLSVVILNSQGLTINDDISLCCFLEQNNQTQEILTMVAVEKKTHTVSRTIPLQELLATATESLIKFLELYPSISDKFCSNEEKFEDKSSLMKIKPNFNYLQMSKDIMQSRLRKEEGQLVPFFPKITNNHFFKEYQRLQSVFVQRRENPEYVEQLISQIAKLHKAKMQKYLGDSPKKPVKRLNTGSASGRNSTIQTTSSESTPNHFFRACLSKSIKTITENEYSLLNIIDRCKETQDQVVSVLVERNPFLGEKTLCKITELICLKYIKADYTKFTAGNSLESTRTSLLYKYLSAVSRARNFKKSIVMQQLDIDDELLQLLEPKGPKSSDQAYFSMLSKITKAVFRPGNCRIATMLFKIVESHLRKVSVQPNIYVFLGGVYLETIMGGVDQISRAKPIANSPYKDQNISDLTNHIKKEKIMEIVVEKGIQSQAFMIQKFFDSLKPIQPNRYPYQVYKDFIFSNYDLLTFIEEVSKPPSTQDQTAIHKLFVQNQFRSKTSPRGSTVFSLFLEDIDQFNLPTKDQQLYLNKSNLFNKTLSSSRFVKQLYNRNPDTKLAGIPIKQVFNQDQKVRVEDLYDRGAIAQKVYGIGLMQAKEHFNLLVNLDNKYRNYQRLSEEDKGFFNDGVQRVLSKEGKLRNYIQKTLDLEIYLRTLQDQ